MAAERWQLWMPFHIDRFRGSLHVQAMPAAARAGYIYLLAAAWQSADCTLPGDDFELQILAGLTAGEWNKLGPLILRRFTKRDDGRYGNDVLQAEWKQAQAVYSRRSVRAEQISEARRAAALSGTGKRWPESKTNGELRSARLSAARAKASHTREEWLALVSVCGNMCVRCEAHGDVVKDHIQPIYQGGSDGIENLQPLCRKCNSSKGPESIDYRPTGWEKSLATNAQTPDKCLTSGQQAPHLTGTEQEQNRTEHKGKDSCAAASATPAVIGIILVTGALHLVTQDALARMSESYPAVDVMQELRKMREWCLANTRNRKTAGGIERFIANWLAREQDKAPRMPTLQLQPGMRAQPATVDPSETLEDINAAKLASWRALMVAGEPIDRAPQWIKDELQAEQKAKVA